MMYNAVKAANGAVPEDNQKALRLGLNREDIYDVAVVSTMSSGKSTFINALAGDVLLPAQNQACTKRITAILDNDLAEDITAHLLFSDGRYQKQPGRSAAQIQELLQMAGDELSDVIIECSIPGIRNIRLSLYIVDTPGVNNANDVSHRERTYAYLDGMASGLIVYLLNATQIGTADDHKTLAHLRILLDKKPAVQVLFVLNKADELDPEKEPIFQVGSNCINYLRRFGFPNPRLFPISADAALQFRRAMAGHLLTRSERARLNMYFAQFRPLDFSLSTYQFLPEQKDPIEKIPMGNTAYLRRDLQSAMENTGLPALEREIEQRIIDQLHTKAPIIGVSV